MKSLEELITSLEACANSDSCDGCAYYNAHKDLTEGMDCDEYALPEMQRDALYYLKKWKDFQDTFEALPDYYDLLDFWDKNHQNYGWASVIKSFFEGRE